MFHQFSVLQQVSKWSVLIMQTPQEEESRIILKRLEQHHNRFKQVLCILRKGFPVVY